MGVAVLVPFAAFGVLYLVAAVITGHIMCPPWYRTFEHRLGAPVELLDVHLPPLSEVHRLSYPKHTSPLADFGLQYQQVVLQVPYERWTNPRSGTEEAMKLRGWFIPLNLGDASGKANQERLNKMLSESPKDLSAQKRTSGRREGVIGVHGAGVDRRELLQ
jgi:hypothetical protein